MIACADAVFVATLSANKYERGRKGRRRRRRRRKVYSKLTQ